ncbi:MAG: polysaccharide deacetylase family protein [Actinomycetota bacterium]|nr:polysaccharide deacetylase family protein [Actinomycetota bacterium]
MTYHNVGSDPTDITDYYVSPELLRNHLSWARQWGTHFVDLLELSEAVAAGRNVDGWAAVCFDDSLAGVHHDALPVLVDLGVPATVFTVSAELGNDPPWWPGAERVMTSGEVEEWSAAGLRVASHTRTHASLTDIPAAQVSEEIKGSRRQLEDLVQGPVTLFAYPYGHYNPLARAVAAEAGYLGAYTFLNGRVTPETDTFRLPRLNMWSGQHRVRLAYHLARTAASWPEHQLESRHGRTPPNAQPPNGAEANRPAPSSRSGREAGAPAVEGGRARAKTDPSLPTDRRPDDT